MDKLKTPEMEIALAQHFNYRQNLIVPNVSWGLYLNRQPLHECDLLVLTKSGYLWEVEIKVSKSDLIADKKKMHGHVNANIRRLYFALPHYLEDCIEHTPERAGIIIVTVGAAGQLKCKQIRAPRNDRGYRLTDKEQYKMARLGALRIWALKNKIVEAEA